MPPLADFATMLGHIKRKGGIPRRDPGISQGASPGAFPGVSQGASQGTNPSLIDFASIFGGGPSTPTGTTGPSAPKTPTFESYDATPELNSANAAEQEAYGMPPTQVRSNYGTKDLLALLVAALAGERGGDVLSGYMQGKQQAQTQRMAAAAQADQMAQQKKLQEAAAIRAGIPFKQSRVDKANQFSNDQFKIQSDAYNKDQSDETKRYLADLASQDQRLKANNDLLMKVPVEGRADWARDRLGITDQKLLDNLPYLTPDNKQKIASANSLNEKTKTIVALRPGQIKNLDNRNSYLLSQADWTKNRSQTEIAKYATEITKAATETAKATLLLPAQAALDMAQAKAAVMNAESRVKDVASMVDTRGKAVDQKRFDAAASAASKAIADATRLTGVAKDRVVKAATDYQLVNASDKTTPEQKDLAKKAYNDAFAFYTGVIKRKSELDKQYQGILKASGISVSEVTEGFGGYDPNRLPKLPDGSNKVLGSLGGEELNTSMFPDQKGKSKITVTDVPGKGAKPKGGAKKILDSRWNRS